MYHGGRGSRNLDLLTIHSTTSQGYVHANCGPRHAYLATVNHRGMKTEWTRAFQSEQQPLEAAHEGRRQVGISVGLLADKGGSWRALRQSTKAAQQRPLPLHWKECKQAWPS